jgi:hypothetical protein
MKINPSFRRDHPSSAPARSSARELAIPRTGPREAKISKSDFL